MNVVGKCSCFDSLYFLGKVSSLGCQAMLLILPRHTTPSPVSCKWLLTEGRYSNPSPSARWGAQHMMMSCFRQVVLSRFTRPASGYYLPRKLPLADEWYAAGISWAHCHGCVLEPCWLWCSGWACCWKWRHSNPTTPFSKVDIWLRWFGSILKLK